MSSNLHTEGGAGVTQLVSGIIGDAQELMKQQLALFRHEVQEDFRKTKEAALSLICGVATFQIGAVLLCFMLVHLISYLAPRLPLWGCFGIVGAALAAIGGAIFAAAVARFKSFNPLPDESARALKENVQWMSNQK
jgi:hypothetical protein